MAVPDFQTIMLPLLRVAGDDNEHTIHEAIEILANEFQLSDEEFNELLPSGKQKRFSNRVGWSRTYLIKSGLLESPRRTYFIITERGKEVLSGNPSKIDMNFLKQFPEYIEFKKRKNKPNDTDGNETLDSISFDNQTPEEILDDAYQEIRNGLIQELLEQIEDNSPAFFENLVVELLVNMGYGGSRGGAARAVGRSGDEGIDGIIDEDRLGLDTIYIQAKKWQDGNSVGRPEIQKFVGALQGKKAKKGIFITSSTFNQNAYNYVHKIESKVVLIDGQRLAELMIDFNVGVSLDTTYHLKKLDSDYFIT